MKHSFISNFNRELIILISSAFFIAVTIILMSELCLYRMGETTPYDEVIQLQLQNNTIYGTKYFNATNKYKILGIEKFQPNLVILGSSRIMPLRQQLFLNRYKIYNAATGDSIGKGLEGMKDIIDSFGDASPPSTVIIGIDPWLLNPTHNRIRRSFLYNILSKHKGTSFFNFLERANGFIRNGGYRFKAYQLLLKEKRNWCQFVFNKRYDLGIGLNAKFFNSGFRLDGSFQLPDNCSPDYFSVVEYKKQLSDNWKFPAAYDIDPEAKSDLEKIFQELNDKGIEVICIILPLYPNFYKAIQELPTHAIFNDKFEDTVMAIAKENDISCYNFSFIDLPSPDKYFDDPIHPNELMMQLIVNRMGIGNQSIQQ